MLLDHHEPMNYEEAMMNPGSAKWLEAMKQEMGSMHENKVWTLIDLPDERRAIENKWIFKKKTDADATAQAVATLAADDGSTISLASYLPPSNVRHRRGRGLLRG